MGLGYIGLPTAALVADAGLQVTGVDINENVVNNINNCAISNQEPGLQEIVEKNIRNGRLKASLTPSPSDVFPVLLDAENQRSGAMIFSVLEVRKSKVKKFDFRISGDTA